MNNRLLYKFLKSKYLLSFLEDGHLKVATLSDLNDPHDLVPCITDIPSGFSITADQWRSWTLNLLSHRHCIMCMSSTCEESVLWAHYADSHKGVALEIECPEDPFLLEVKYSNERATIPFGKFINPSLFTLEDIKLVLTRKGLSWACESEVRFVVPFEHRVPRNDIYMLRLPDNFLKSIILGYNSELDERVLRDILDRGPFKSATIKRARLSNSTFKIEVH